MRRHNLQNYFFLNIFLHHFYFDPSELLFVLIITKAGVHVRLKKKLTTSPGVLGSNKKDIAQDGQLRAHELLIDNDNDITKTLKMELMHAS